MGLQLRIVRDPYREVAKAAVRGFGVEGGDIGRSPDSYWVLPDPKCYISACHCRIEFDEGVYWIRDVSRNGVFRNGASQPVGRGRRVSLCAGDRLRLANYELAVSIEGGAAAPHDDGPGATRVFDSETHDDDEVRHREQSVATLESPQFPGSPESPELAELRESRELPESPAEPAFASNGPAPASPLGPHPEPVRPSVVAAMTPVPESDCSKVGHDQPPGPRTRANDLSAQAVQAANTAAPAASAAVASSPSTVARRFRAVAMDPSVMERHGILLGAKHEAAFRAYKMLRTRMHRRLTANKWRSVIVTGEGPGVGKTVTATNLAITFANDPRTPAVLIDLDLHRPQIANYLGLKIDKGLSDYLLGEATIEEIICQPEQDGLLLVANSKPLGHVSELLTSPRMVELVRYLEQHLPRHLIVYDMPPLLMSDDVLVFSPHADCILDVVAVGVTRRASLEASRELLSELNVVGIVLNRSTGADSIDYGYYY